MLNLDDLGNSYIPGITPNLGNALSEAGAICLESQGHLQGVRLAVRGLSDHSYGLAWTPALQRAPRAWQPNRATEFGAEGIAVLLAKNETQYTVIEATVRSTGIDYWLGNESDITLQRKARLEVSGIRSAHDSTITQRVNDKLTQTNQSDDTQLPAYVIVVEFSRPVAEVHEK